MIAYDFACVVYAISMLFICVVYKKQNVNSNKKRTQIVILRKGMRRAHILHKTYTNHTHRKNEYKHIKNDTNNVQQIYIYIYHNHTTNVQKQTKHMHNHTTNGDKSYNTRPEIIHNTCKIIEKRIQHIHTPYTNHTHNVQQSNTTQNHTTNVQRTLQTLTYKHMQKAHIPKHVQQSNTNVYEPYTKHSTINKQIKSCKI